MRTIIPGGKIVVDESMSEWRGKDLSSLMLCVEKTTRSFLP